MARAKLYREEIRVSDAGKKCLEGSLLDERSKGYYDSMMLKRNMGQREKSCERAQY